MKLIKQVISELPVLAWLAEILPTESIVYLKHGELVETGDNYFVEGVWNGVFSAHDFHQTDAFFGSGGRLESDEFIIVPSASTTDYCYYQKNTSGHYFFSNSLPFLLAAVDDSLDPMCRDYLRINNSILRGISSYDSKLPTQYGEVKRLLHFNLRWTAGNIKLEMKKNSPSFKSYKDYTNYLSTCYGEIASNARDPSRHHPLQITSTQSKGYDSTAVNAIAKKNGLDAVFSIARGKGAGKFADQDQTIEVDDSGEKIGEALGFKCTFIERRALSKKHEYEHLYYASIHASEDTNMVGINAHIKAPTLLLTGCMGEITETWNHYYSRGYNVDYIADQQRGDHGGHGMGEIRLTIGFIHLPFFYIGARQRKDIMDITASKEMDPWRMHNNYDRPISRRIAEDAKVPRADFGQRKNATAMVFTPPLIPNGNLLREEYISYLNNSGVMPRWKFRFIPLVHRINQTLWFISPKNHLWLYYIQRLISRMLRRDYQLPIVWQYLDNVFYCFCVNKRTNEYKLILFKK